MAITFLVNFVSHGLLCNIINPNFLYDNAPTIEFIE